MNYKQLEFLPREILCIRNYHMNSPMIIVSFCNKYKVTYLVTHDFVSLLFSNFSVNKTTRNLFLRRINCVDKQAGSQADRFLTLIL